ncbi:MAG: hypothetical protein WC707_00025 [Candidatus Babeliaceae bacterium]|jgi:hypothetical protein
MKKFLMYICAASCAFSAISAGNIDPFDSKSVVNAVAKGAFVLPFLGVSVVSAFGAVPCFTLTALSTKKLVDEYKKERVINEAAAKFPTFMKTVRNNKATTALGIFSALGTIGFSALAYGSYKFASKI